MQFEFVLQSSPGTILKDCQKHHFVPNIYISIWINTTQDIYLVQSEFVPNSSNHFERYYLFQIDISIRYKKAILQCTYIMHFHKELF